MMLTRGWIVLVALAGACSRDKGAPPAPAKTEVAKPSPKADGPVVTPSVTSSITFFTPKDASWWVEASFACYAAAISLQPGVTPSAAFDKISPVVAPALKAADIDLDHDLVAFGMWGCGEGACMYGALALRHPDKLADMLGVLVPGVKPKQVGKDAYTIEAPGMHGPRTIHLQALPIAWPKPLPTDTWSLDAARATHVVFVTGLFDKTSESDPLAIMADPQAASARVHDTEGVTSDPHGMCVRGQVARRAFLPGFQLDHARFALVAPAGKPDALAQLVGANRTLDLEVELALDPAPSTKVVDGWISQARAWVAQTMEPVRAQFGAGNPLVDMIFQVGALIGNKGFHHDIKDKSLVLSWRTDRISSSDLAGVETQLEGALKAAGIAAPR